MWRATNRILVLHLSLQLKELLAAEAVAGEDLLGIKRQLGLCQQVPDDTCTLDLTGMRLLLVDKGVEVSPVSEQSLRRHRRAQVGNERQHLRVPHRQSGERAHERGPVGQGEAFLGLELQRLQAQLTRNLLRVLHLAVVQDLHFANESGAHIRKRHQISTGAAGAPLRDEREYIVVQVEEEAFNQFKANTGVAPGETVGSQEHRCPRNLRQGNWTCSAAQKAEHVLLQTGSLGRGYLAVRAVPEARRDAIDGGLA